MQWLQLEVESIGPGRDDWGDTHQHYLDRLCLSGLLFPLSLCELCQRGWGVSTLQ